VIIASRVNEQRYFVDVAAAVVTKGGLPNWTTAPTAFNIRVADERSGIPPPVVILLRWPIWIGIPPQDAIVEPRRGGAPGVHPAALVGQVIGESAVGHCR